jgi:hypothetical protein
LIILIFGIILHIFVFVFQIAWIGQAVTRSSKEK